MTVDVLRDARLNLLDSPQCLVPSPFQFVRDQAVFRVRGIVLLLCAPCRVPCSFQVTPERVYNFILGSKRNVVFDPEEDLSWIGRFVR